MRERIELNRNVEKYLEMKKLNDFVCHSTSQDNIINIIKSGKLKSINLLEKENVKVIPSSFHKKIDIEDTDFIEFAPVNSKVGEYVVGNRKEEQISTEEQKYKPSVRIIFSKEKIEKLPNSEVKELSVKIKDELDLELADYIVFPSLETYKEFESSIEDERLKNITSKKAIIVTEIESSDPDSYINNSNRLILDRLS